MPTAAGDEQRRQPLAPTRRNHHGVDTEPLTQQDWIRASIWATQFLRSSGSWPVRASASGTTSGVVRGVSDVDAGRPAGDPRTATHAHRAAGSGLDAIARLMADARAQLLAEHDVVR
jgi:hypothetical protein